jgi:3-oxoacyl-[acyl-carrier protein] reductase
MTPLQGRVAAVVGASSGWGYASALRLSADGADLLLVDDDEDGLAAAQGEIQRRGGRVSTAVADIANYDDLRVVVQRSELDRLDVLVNHHARMSWGTVEALDLAEFADVVRFNLVGPMASTRAFLGLLKQAGQASVINLGTVDGLFGNPVAVAYSASKAGLGPITRIMAREFAPHNIRVNAVASAQTNQVRAADLEVGTHGDAAGSRPPNQPPGSLGSLPHYPGDKYMEGLGQATPLKRFGPPEEWAGTVAFLASDHSTYVTGSVIVVDCGRTGLTPGTFPWDSASTT